MRRCPSTHRLSSISLAGPPSLKARPSNHRRPLPSGTALQNQCRFFNEMGSQIQRQDNNRSLIESFCYDSLYHRSHSTLIGSCSGTTKSQMTYDPIGNIIKTSEVSPTLWTYTRPTYIRCECSHGGLHPSVTTPRGSASVLALRRAWRERR